MSDEAQKSDGEDLIDEELVQSFRALEAEYREMYDSMVRSHESWIRNAAGVHYQAMLKSPDYALDLLHDRDESVVCAAIHLAARHQSALTKVVQFCMDHGARSESSRILQTSISVISTHAELSLRSKACSLFASIVADASLDDLSRISAYLAIVRLTGTSPHDETTFLPNLTIDDIDWSFVQRFMAASA